MKSLIATSLVFIFQTLAGASTCSNYNTNVSLAVDTLHCFNSASQNESIDTTETELTLKFLGLESYHPIDDWYSFYDPYVSASCECSCLDFEGLCSNQTKIRNARCSREQTAKDRCFSFYKEVDNSPLCTDFHKFCCQVRLSIDNPGIEMKAFSLARSFRYFFRLDICKVDCEEYSILNDTVWFIYSKDLIMEFISPEFPNVTTALDHSWYFQSNSSIVVVNAYRETDLKKRGWYKLFRNGQVQTIDERHLQNAFSVDTDQCDRVIDDDWDIDANGYVNSQRKLIVYDQEMETKLQTVFGNSFVSERINGDNNVVVKHVSLPLQVKIWTDFDQRKDCVTFTAIIRQKETSKKTLELELHSGEGKGQVIVYDQQFEEEETFDIDMDVETYPKLFTYHLSIAVSGRCWVRLVAHQGKRFDTVARFIPFRATLEPRPTSLSSRKTEETIVASNKRTEEVDLSSISIVVGIGLLIILIVAVGMFFCVKKKKCGGKNINSDIEMGKIEQNTQDGQEESQTMLPQETNVDPRPNRSCCFKTRTARRGLSPQKIVANHLRACYEKYEELRLPWMKETSVKKLDFNFKLVFSSREEEKLSDDLISYSKLFAGKKGKTEIPVARIILGESGSGKTVLVHRIMYDWKRKKNHLKKFKLVFFMPKNCRITSRESLLKEIHFTYSKDNDILKKAIEDCFESISARILIILEISEATSMRVKQQLLKMKEFENFNVLLTVRSGRKFWTNNINNGNSDLFVYDMQGICREHQDDFLRKFSKRGRTSTSVRDPEIPFTLLMSGMFDDVQECTRRSLIDEHVKSRIKRFRREKSLTNSNLTIDLYKIKEDQYKPIRSIIDPLANNVYCKWKKKLGLVETVDEVTMDPIRNLLEDEELFDRQGTILHDSFEDYFVAYHLFEKSISKDVFTKELNFLFQKGLGPNRLTDIYSFLLEMLKMVAKVETFWEALTPWAIWYHVNEYDKFGNHLFVFGNANAKEEMIPNFIPPKWEIKKSFSRFSGQSDFSSLSQWHLKNGKIKVIFWDLRYACNFPRECFNQIPVLELVFDTDYQQGMGSILEIDGKIRCNSLICYINRFEAWTSFVSVLEKIDWDLLEIVVSNKVSYQFLAKMHNSDKIPFTIDIFKCCVSDDDASSKLELITNLVKKGGIKSKLFVSADNPNPDFVRPLFESCVETNDMEAFAIPPFQYSKNTIKPSFVQKFSKKKWEYLGIDIYDTFGLESLFQLNPKSVLPSFNIETVEFSYPKDNMESVLRFLKQCRDLKGLTCVPAIIREICQKFSNWNGFKSVTRLDIKLHQYMYSKNDLKEISKFVNIQEIGLVHWNTEDVYDSEDLEAVIKAISRRPKSTLKISQIDASSEGFLNHILRNVPLTTGLILKLEFADVLKEESIKKLLSLLKDLFLSEKVKYLQLYYPSQELVDILSDYFYPPDYRVVYEMNAENASDPQFNQMQVNLAPVFREFISISLDALL